MGLLAKLPRWATGGGAQITEPLESKKDDGWVPAEKPPAQYFNWLFKTLYDACVVLDGLLGQALTWTAKHTFSSGADFNGPVTVQTPTLAAHATRKDWVEALVAAPLGGDLVLTKAGDQSIGKTGSGKLTIGSPAGSDLEVDLVRNGVTAMAIGAGGCADFAAKEAKNAANPTVGTSLATKDYVDTRDYLVAAVVNSVGTLAAQKGQVSVSSSRNGTGNYSVTVPGITSNGMVLVTPKTSGARFAVASMTTGSVTVLIYDAAGAEVDTAFTILVIAL